MDDSLGKFDPCEPPALSLRDEIDYRQHLFHVEYTLCTPINQIRLRFRLHCRSRYDYLLPLFRPDNTY